jgi:hypothetical protein
MGMRPRGGRPPPHVLHSPGDLGILGSIPEWCRGYLCISMSANVLVLINVIPILWITKEIMSRGPQVADMECRETT